MKELSIFVDESGDFGEYEIHAPFYIVTLVFHDQSIEIAENINLLNNKIRDSGLPDYPIHAGPIIRREYEFKYLRVLTKR